jgi:hypothetical protein
MSGCVFVRGPSALPCSGAYYAVKTALINSSCFCVLPFLKLTERIRYIIEMAE